MTRLTSADVRPLESSLVAHDQHLTAVTGLDLAGLALEAADLPADAAHRKGLADLEMAVVPITGGLGLIGGFARSVAAILNQIGCRSFVTLAADVAGIAEAVAQGPTALFMSDDRDFFALDPSHRTSVHNTPATAEGFVAGLAGMAGGLEGKQVLLLGCGPLGGQAAEALLDRGARLTLVDRIPERCVVLREGLMSRDAPQARIQVMGENPPRGAELIFDATNTGDHIDVEMIGKRTLVAAPGMPCGITAAARRTLGNRLLHDPLQIGVATMAAKIYAARVKKAQISDCCDDEEGTRG